jgi:predicted HicB family RNase H-like nuclease
MLHIRLDPDLHRALRVIVAEQDTTLQEWVVRTLAAAAHAAGVRDSSDDPDKD